MAYHVDAEHIRQLLRRSTVEVCDKAVSRRAEDFLYKHLPLRDHSTIIDWSRLPATVLDWQRASDADAIEWARGTAAGIHEYALVLYSGDEPCLCGDFDYMVGSFDELVWRAPGPRLLFGVDRDIEFGQVLFSTGIIEFDGKGTLFGLMKPTT